MTNPNTQLIIPSLPATVLEGHDDPRQLVMETKRRLFVA